MSDRRKRYLLEGLEELRADLRAMGGDLLVRKGKAEEVLPTLAEQLHAKRVVTALGEALRKSVPIENCCEAFANVR